MAVEEVLGPDANGMYSRVIDGEVVETWQGTAGLQSGSVAPVSNTTLIDTRGHVVPAGTAPVDPLATAAPAPATTTSTPPARRASGSDWATPRGGSGGGGDYGSGYGGGVGSFGGGAGYASDDPFAGLPAYQGGQRHPAAGGDPRVPGGLFADQGTGYDDRQQIYSDSGASAGPFGVQSPRSPHNPLMNRAFDESGRAYATRGDNRSPLYDTFAAKGQAMESKVRGMAGAIQGKLEGGGQASAATADPYAQQQRQYARQGKRMDRAYERYNDELYDPDPMAVKGWSKRQGFKPGTIDAALADPTMLLTSVFPGYESRDTPYHEGIESLPMTDLALIAGGTRGKRGLTSKTPVVDVPHILQKQGVKPVKPENKRTLDSSKVANRVASMYKSLGQPGTIDDVGWLDSQKMLGNLATAKKGGILRQNLRTQFESDPAAAMQSAGSYVRSALSAGPDTVVSRALIEDVDRQVTNQGSKLLRMKPKRADRIVKSLARSYL